MIQQSTKAAVVVFHSARKQELAKKTGPALNEMIAAEAPVQQRYVSLLLRFYSI